jgi:hypothetical protein
MRWTWVVPIFLVALALAGGRSLHIGHRADHRDAMHMHSHGHTHDGEYHEHHHAHDEAITCSLDEHAEQPHEHGWTNAPEEESNPTTLTIAPPRRDQLKPHPATAVLIPVVAFLPSALDKPPAIPPPRSRAGPHTSQLTILRSIILQV